MISDWAWIWGCGWIFIALFCIVFVLGVIAERTRDCIHFGGDLV